MATRHHWVKNMNDQLWVFGVAPLPSTMHIDHPSFALRSKSASSTEKNLMAAMISSPLQQDIGSIFSPMLDLDSAVSLRVTQRHDFEDSVFSYEVDVRPLV
eukprot:scaffold2224_cov167-Cylindrotheca_fusiformis.AAC.2